MIKTQLTDQHGVTWLRVSKLRARRAFELDNTVLMCPSKLEPFDNLESVSRASRINDKTKPFNQLAMNATWYNCSKESGLYLSYYIKQ